MMEDKPDLLLNKNSSIEKNNLLNFGKRWLKRTGVVLLGAAGSYLAISMALAYPLSSVLVKPRKKRLVQLNSNHLQHFLRQRRIKYREFKLRSFDGTILHGWLLLVNKKCPTIIALHGVSGNRTNMLRFALILYEAGFNVCIFDGRAHGLSEGEFVTYGYHEVHDVSSVIDYLIYEEEVNENLFGLIGQSMGAAISLQVAAFDKRIKAVWAECPFSSLDLISAEYLSNTVKLPTLMLKPMAWTATFLAGKRGNFNVNDVSPLKAAEHVKCAAQLVHGTNDTYIKLDHSKKIYEALATEHKDLWVVKGGTHAKCFPVLPKEYSERLVKFFIKNLT